LKQLFQVHVLKFRKLERLPVIGQVMDCKVRRKGSSHMPESYILFLPQLHHLLLLTPLTSQIHGISSQVDSKR
jgi:hypothetical protein